MFGKSPATPVDMELFAIYDSKSQSYGKILFAKNKDVLMRDILGTFQDEKEQKVNQLFTNAEDFSLFRIGTYSYLTGKIDPINAEHVTNLHDLRALAAPRALSST